VASSHREAPLIANDPLADNTDLYAFRSPDDPNYIIIIANYVPMQLPHGGPNYYSFGENIRYEVHIDNDLFPPRVMTSSTGSPSTRRTRTLRPSSMCAWASRTRRPPTPGAQHRWRRLQVVKLNGTVPPNNIGQRSIRAVPDWHHLRGVDGECLPPVAQR
jgi:hypothetical protein